MIFCFGLEMGKSFSGFPEYLFLPIEELLLEILELTLIHELFVLGGTIVRILRQHSDVHIRHLESPRKLPRHTRAAYIKRVSLSTAPFAPCL
jgi:hypothetical protein